MKLITAANRLRATSVPPGRRLTVCTAYVRSGAFTRAYGEQAKRELLAQPEAPTAIFAGNTVF